MTMANDAKSRLRRVRGGAGADLATEVRRMILAGDLRPGQRIDQEQLADDFGVSRLPVREALIALTEQGLVDTIPRRGCYVAQLTPDDVLDQYELYGAVSGLAAARAAERLTVEEKVALRAAHERFVAATTNPAREQANEDFHRIINRAAGSRVRSLIRLMSKSLPSEHYRFTSTWSKISARHHDKVLRAIERSDPLAARQAMEEHLIAGGEEAVVVLERQGFWAESDPAEERAPES